MGQPVQDRPEHPDRGLDVAASHRLEERRVKRFAHRDGHGEQDGHGERDSLEYTRPIASGRHTGEDAVETPNTAAIIMGPRITSHWGMAFIPVALPNRRCIHKKGTTRISSVPSAQIMTAIHMALLMGGSSVVER